MTEMAKVLAQEFLRENLCLDFLNPVPGPEDEDYFFSSYEQVLVASEILGVIPSSLAASLRETAISDPQRADASRQGIQTAREALRRILVATVENVPPSAGDLKFLNEALLKAIVPLRLVRTGTDFVVDWAFEPTDLDSVLWPVIKTAVELLLSSDLSRLRVCEGCGWLFQDTSKNHSRRWCRMKDCGNRKKVRTHRERKGILRSTI